MMDKYDRELIGAVMIKMGRAWMNPDMPPEEQAKLFDEFCKIVEVMYGQHKMRNLDAQQGKPS